MFNNARKPWPTKGTGKPAVIAIATFKGELVEVLDETQVGSKQYLINDSGPKWVSSKDVTIVDRYWSKK